MSKIVLAGFALLAGGYYLHTQSQPVPIENPPSIVQSGLSVVYFGAHDCPSCRSFKSTEMTRMINEADRLNVRFIIREEYSLRRLGKDDAFGDFASVWKATLKRERNAVPAFVLIKDGKLVDSRVGGWRGIIASAQTKVAQR